MINSTFVILDPSRLLNRITTLNEDPSNILRLFTQVVYITDVLNIRQNRIPDKDLELIAR
jgi:hypothetical protein